MVDNTSPPLYCNDLSVGYGGNPVLRNVSVSVDAGSTIALAGPSGCGKTTLLKTLAGILEPMSGEAVVVGTTLPATPPPGSLGYIPQNLGIVLHETVLRNVLHGTLTDLSGIRSVFGRFPERAKQDAVDAINRVGLAGTEHHRVSTLSGGQRRRVAIARAFVQQPTVLLADEILSELDEVTAQSVITCMQELQQETAMAVLLVEHNTDIAEEIADRLLFVDSDRHQQPVAHRSQARL